MARLSRKAGMTSCSETWPSSAQPPPEQRAVGRAGVEGRFQRRPAERADAGDTDGVLEQRPLGLGGRFARQALLLADLADQQNAIVPATARRKWREPSLSLFVRKMARSGGGPFSAESWRGCAPCKWAGPPGRDGAAVSTPTSTSEIVPSDQTKRIGRRAHAARPRESSWPRGSRAARPAAEPELAARADRGT